MNGWIVDKSAASRTNDPVVAAHLAELAGRLHICPFGQLEQLYSARSAQGYELGRAHIAERFIYVRPPEDIFERVLTLQRDLAHHHGMWHRIALPDLFIAETALHHALGVLHVDNDYERIAEVRPVTVRRLL